MTTRTNEVKDFLWEDIKERHESSDTKEKDKAFVDAMNYFDKCNVSDENYIKLERAKIAQKKMEDQKKQEDKELIVDLVKVGVTAVMFGIGVSLENFGHTMNFSSMKSLLPKIKF